ncbi:acetyl/propionyl/methylcrotonyl-CoA carboxylase subunit alpha [Thermophagus sp. OGC60D27]|uniref:acetyl/propionyl/methylcrotonyl-CoA carboxylase subunit alpha n=1 Tax=Thermophagus sp. OGC60D27 TaxID=3458415 RepID=UPI004037D8C5
MNNNITKIFIANRGEIAYRIIRTASRLGISTVLPVIKEETKTLPAKAADEIHILDSSQLHETYLNGQYMIDLAKKYGADAIHPGYGFLSENAQFAKLVENSGLTWIGPSPRSMAVMANKLKARELAIESSVPVTKAISGKKQKILDNLHALQFPLLIKAAAGGGGKGMKIAHNENELITQLENAEREAQNYFGDNTIFVEEYIDNPRHIEVQILGDHHGKVIHLYERECSIQRRFQKIMEEAPSSLVNESLRHSLTSDALKLAQKIGYYNAGTVEFLVDKKGQHYFLEMNTRLQVEHLVTEAITGIDLVEEQIKVAQGLPISFEQKGITKKGHAIEARIYAEDALNNFLPSPGAISYVQWPNSNKARIDSFFDSPTEVQPGFDPLLAKMTVWGDSREEAIQRLLDSLKNTTLVGIPTNLPYLRELTKTNAFLSGDTTTHFATIHKDFLQKAIHPNGSEKTELLLAAYAVWITLYRNKEDQKNVWNKLGHRRWGNSYNIALSHQNYTIKARKSNSGNAIEWSLNNGKKDNIHNIEFGANQMRFFYKKKWRKLSWHISEHSDLLFNMDGHTYNLLPAFRINNTQPFTKDKETYGNNDNRVIAPIPGKISKILITNGDTVTNNTPVAILEAMKMENTLHAQTDGIIKTINIKEGEQVKAGQILVEIKKSSKEIMPEEIHNNQ